MTKEQPYGYKIIEEKEDLMSTERNLYKNAEEPVNDNNPWQDDVLERSKIAIKLTKAIKTITQPFVVSIDAPFGGGKTFFLRRWHQQLKSGGYNTVYFNAWETDYANDSLIAFLEELEENFLKGSAKKVAAAKTAGRTLLGNMALNALEAGTLGIVKKEDFKEAKENSEKIQTERMSLFKETKKSIADFKNSLGEYGKELREKDEENRPIVIFIDELDRCRPTYAVELLENIKHFFNIPNFVFVLGIDRKQLMSSASAIYGNDLDGDGYINKFLDFNYVLPDPETKNYVKNLYNKFSLKDVVTEDDNLLRSGPDLVRHFANLADFFNLSLREQEQLFTKLNFIIRVLFTENQLLLNPLLCLLLILREEEPDIYKKYCTETRKEKLVVDYFCSLPGGKDFLFSGRSGEVVYMAILIGAADDISYIKVILEQLVDKTNKPDYRESQEDIYMKKVYSRSIALMERMDFHYAMDGFIANYIYKRIEDKDQH